MTRTGRLLAVLLAVVVLAGCSGSPVANLGSSPTPTPTLSGRLLSDRFVSANPSLLVGATLEQLRSPAEHVAATVPAIAKSTAFSTAVHIVRNAMLRNFAAAGGQNLELDWQLVASSQQAVGVLLTADQTLSTGRAKTVAAVWYDPIEHRTYASPALIAKGHWADFTNFVTKAAEKVPGVDAGRLATALREEAQPRGNGPAIGFNEAGDLLAAFAGGSVVPGTMLTVVVVPADLVTPVLSPFGVKAHAAAIAPSAFDVQLAPKAPAPLAPSTKAQPASPAMPGGYPSASGAVAVTGEPQEILPLATTSAQPTPPSATPEATVSAQPSPSSSVSPKSSTAPKPTVAPSIAKAPSAKPSASDDDRPNIYVVPDCQRLNCVALTFDDGPSSAETAVLLRSLVKAKVPATFFVLGPMIESQPQLVLREAALGMEVASHTWRHVPMRDQSAQVNTTNLTKNIDAIAKITGERPLLMRPPYGNHSRSVDALIGAANQAIVQWSVDTRDWESKNTAAIITHALNEVRPGGVILMHDVQSATTPAVPVIIDGLQRAGYTIVTVAELSQPGDWAPGSYFCSAPWLAESCW